jgi:hypothetical protein
MDGQERLKELLRARATLKHYRDTMASGARKSPQLNRLIAQAQHEVNGVTADIAILINSGEATVTDLFFMLDHPEAYGGEA